LFKEFNSIYIQLSFFILLPHW